MGLDAGNLLDAFAYFVGPRFRAEDAVLELRVAAEVDSEFFGDGREMQEVARRAADDRHAQVLHQHDLLLRVACARGEDGASEPLRAIVRAEAAGEEPVAVGDLHDVVFRDAVHRHAAHDAVGPYSDVLSRLRDADGLAGGAGRAVEAVDLRHRRGREAERIFVAEVRLLHEWELREVGERREVSRLHAFLVAAPAEERDVLVFVGDEFLQFLKLHLSQLGNRHVVGF